MPALENMSKITRVGKDLDIAIVGETNLDLVLYGLPEELPLEREILGSGFQLTLGGSSSILAHNLATLGTHVGFTSTVGNDEMGHIALDRLAQSGLALDHVSLRKDKGTGVTILLPHGKERRTLTYQGVMADLKVEDLDVSYLLSARHFHLSSLFLQTSLHRGLPELMDTLKTAGLTLSLDTNDDPDDRWGGVLSEVLDRIDFLLPNEDEVKRMTSSDTVEAALDCLAGRVETVVVKCGARGALVQQGNTRHWVSPHLVQPVDTIGAGDSFNAGFLHSWLNGADVLQAAGFGNRTGALSTLRPGGTEAFRDKVLREQFLGVPSHH